MIRSVGPFFQILIVLLVSFSSLPHSEFETENWMDQANGFLRDLKFYLRGPQAPSGDVVVVAIGEDSLAQMRKSWPWKRRYQAALIDEIFKKGAKNIGVDIIWDERDSAEAYDNQILQGVLNKYAERITFAWMAQCLGANCDPQSNPQKNFSLTIHNDPFFEKNITSQGFVNASKSARGKIDKAIYWVQDLNQRLPSMPLASVAQRLKVDASTLDVPEWSLINFLGPAKTLPRIEAWCFFDDTDNCALEAGILENKTVILGVTALGVGDQVATSFDKVVDGVEIQANIAEQILHRRIPRKSSWLFWGFSLVLSGVLVFLSSQLRSVYLLLIFVGLIFSGVFCDLLLFSKNIFIESALFYANTVFLGLSVFCSRFYQEYQQKQFLKSAFSRYLSPEIVKILMRNPEVLRLGGQKREMTILFCDLRNFTSISERLSPEKLTALLNEILTLLTEILFKYGGTVDKYIGDAVMAFFNAPLDQPDHAFLACQAALEMAEKVEQKKEDLQSRYGVDIRMGIGLNTGEAHVGNLGSNQRFNYSALGDAVNIAARVESATKEFEASVLVTQSTLDAIRKTKKATPRFQSVGLVPLKGKSQSLELFKLGPFS